ncbi:MAG: ABC transporter substrate-binding protein, partial [Nitrosopumilus sp. (ex Thoosa mismalolli)]|nr:ABC transporter substrate-binding protein [Nitrosopumilus sp. (ex Thoosa mismalolli)]
MGFSDSYSRHIWGIVSDPGTFKHPFTGETIPVRTNWTVETAGPDGKLEIPSDAAIWSPITQNWQGVGDGKTVSSKVTYDFEFSNWHNGEKMDMQDIVYWYYFKIEWGTQTDENDKTFDTEFTPRAAQSIQTIKGIKQIDENTIEVYVDYWHFDDGEIAEWPSLWSGMPWELMASMEKAVTDGKVSFSRSGATSKNISWLSLLIPNDANQIKNNLDEFAGSDYIPKVFEGKELDSEYFNNRYNTSSDWIERNHHAVISNGPFYLKSYSPESRTIQVNAFTDESYPFSKGKWSEFENPDFATIEKIEAEKVIKQGSDSKITVKTSNANSILYFMTNSFGELVTSNHIKNIEDETTIEITSDETWNLELGANNIKIFAVSDSVLKPDFYETSFILASSETDLPENSIVENFENEQKV